MFSLRSSPWLVFSRLVVAAVLLSFFATASLAGDPEDASHGLFVESVNENGTYPAYSSCTYIGDGLFTTCYHCVAQRSGAIIVTDYDRGICYEAEFAGGYKDCDLAVVKTSQDVEAEPVVIATLQKPIGQRVSAFGYGQGYHSIFTPSMSGKVIFPDRRKFSGRVVEEISVQHDQDSLEQSFSPGAAMEPNGLMLVGQLAVTGDSGCGFFTESGELVATISGVNPYNTFTTSNAKLRKLVAEVKRASK